MNEDAKAKAEAAAAATGDKKAGDPKGAAPAAPPAGVEPAP